MAESAHLLESLNHDPRLAAALCAQRDPPNDRRELEVIRKAEGERRLRLPLVRCKITHFALLLALLAGALLLFLAASPRQHANAAAGVADVVREDLAFCGPVDRDTEYHTRRPLYWVGNILGWEECCAECDVDPECGAWTHRGNHCYLKRLAPGEEPRKVPREGVTSGGTGGKFKKHGVVATVMAQQGADMMDKNSSLLPDSVRENETCAGTVDIEGYGRVQVAAAMFMRQEEEAAPVEVPHGWAVMPRLNSRAYLTQNCSAGDYSNVSALKVLGKRIRYTTDITHTACGCNARLHLVPLKASIGKDKCGDGYCGPEAACGAKCGAVGLQDANQYAWATQMWVHDDVAGMGGGYGGGDGVVGRRQWNESVYGPGALCIDTSWPFMVEVAFPVDELGLLMAVDVTLTQPKKSCPLKMHLNSYSFKGRDALAEVSLFLSEGVTPMVAYSNSSHLAWLDGAGPDGLGPCVQESPEACPETVRFYDFAILEQGEEVPSSGIGAEDDDILGEAMDEVHDHMQSADKAKRDEAVAALEENADMGDDECMGGCSQAIRLKSLMAPYSNGSSAEQPETAREDPQAKSEDYLERVDGNEEWVVEEEAVLIMGNNNKVLMRRTKGEVLVGRIDGDKLVLFHNEGSVELAALRQRTVSYETISKGSCGDVGLSAVGDLATCLHAGMALGYFSDAQEYSGPSKRPEGCYILKGQIWLASNPANRHHGVVGDRLPICSSGGYATTTSTSTTTTTTTTTRTTTWLWPSLFCVEVTRAGGYEFPLVKEQLRQGASIFACDECAVFSDGGKPRLVGIGPNLKEIRTIVIPKIKQNMGHVDFAAGLTTNSWLNTATFLQVWELLKKDGRFQKHDWLIKVDPDAVFFPHRLRPHVRGHTYNGAAFYFLNCRRWEPALFGSIEIFSKEAMNRYLAGQWSCRKQLPWHGWGEDYFISHCMDMLGVGRIYDWTLLSDKRCYFAPCGDTSKVVFHDYKDARPDGKWFKCWRESIRR